MNIIEVSWNKTKLPGVFIAQHDGKFLVSRNKEPYFCFEKNTRREAISVACDALRSYRQLFGKELAF